ncbi:MAG TPA: sigma-54-dependent Fis family transcriptional regulator [Pirellulales bacterium]|nr:sigma-54-dependent Fis family transcriptional regulator [Pirellulales bacterium]
MRDEPPGVFISSALGSLLSSTADYAAVVNVVGERGTVLGDTGRPAPLPWKWLGEVVDGEAPAHQGPWVAVPLESQSSEVLALHTPNLDAAAGAYRVASRIARCFGEALKAVRSRQREHRRAQRLDAILEISGHWYLAREMEPLLVQMAQAATRLLDGDRASIFLWDRPNHVLVARPALGVPGGELRIADNLGQVGQVVHSGQARRIDLDRDQQLIDRTVDTRLGYRTRTLVCVPLRSMHGEILGAFEVLNKREGNFTDDDEQALAELAQHAAIALENTQERARLLETRRQLSAQAAQGVNLVGQSAVIEALRSTIKRVANTDLAILIMGENGTGKEVVSQSVHYLSNRSDHPFIAVNCAALTETLLESELFGHEKGAFTDAHEARPGKFELANGGTLFLDEIGDLSAGGQAKLLRVLEEKVVVRVGGSKTIPTDARVIAATNQDLGQMVREKRFRQDLYYRLNVVTLTLPPLRERPDDIWLLAEFFLNDFCLKARRRMPRLSPTARRRLEAHSWPGNVRELRNLMERIAYLVPGDEIQPDDLSLVPMPSDEAARPVAADLELSEATSRFQSQYIEQAIAHSRGNMSRAAEQLGLHRSNLYRKMRQLGMNVTE